MEEWIAVCEELKLGFMVMLAGTTPNSFGIYSSIANRMKVSCLFLWYLKERGEWGKPGGGMDGVTMSNLKITSKGSFRKYGWFYFNTAIWKENLKTTEELSYYFSWNWQKIFLEELKFPSSMHEYHHNWLKTLYLRWEILPNIKWIMQFFLLK